MDDWWKLLPPETVITPHPVKWRVLLSQQTNEIQGNRWKIGC